MLLPPDFAGPAFVAMMPYKCIELIVFNTDGALALYVQQASNSTILMHPMSLYFPFDHLCAQNNILDCHPLSMPKP